MMKKLKKEEPAVKVKTATTTVTTEVKETETSSAAAANFSASKVGYTLYIPSESEVRFIRLSWYDVILC